MKKRLPHPFLEQLHSLAEGLIVLVIIIASSVILGYITDIEFLKRWGPGYLGMNPLSAIFFIMIGIAVILVRNEQYSARAGKISRMLSLLVSIVSIIKLISILVGFNFSPDKLLFREKIY